MAKRNRLEIIRDILLIISKSKNGIKPTPLLRQTNISSSRFKEYYTDLIDKKFIEENIDRKNGKTIKILPKGQKFLEKYRTIIEFIEEFEL